MSESRWLNSRNQYELLALAQRTGRKDRLLAVACLREGWEFLVHGASRRVVWAAEAFADGLISEPELAAAREAAEAVVDRRLIRAFPHSISARQHAASWAAPACASADLGVVADVLRASWFVCRSRRKVDELGHAEAVRRCDLIRCVYPNPYRLVDFDRGWGSWDGGAVTRFARSTYDERSFDQLPVLADMLEEAGCLNPWVMSHCRGPGPHVRGCWALDLILGKQ